MRVSQRQGIAAVEFAVVLPVIVLIVFGVLELGCMIHVQGALQNASREGARHAITRRATAASVAEACQQSLSLTTVKGAVISVTPDPTQAESGSMIRVRISADYLRNSWLPGNGLFRGASLSSEVVMRKE
jgi:Flp pilus assembly protein TadG